MFDYDEAFSRNLGWVTCVEQAILRGKRIAIAGMGGVGGSHLLTLTRLGVGAFNIADFDTFELANFNRQAGAFVSQLDRPKVDVLGEMARDINPTLDVKTYPAGVDLENLDDFLADVDLYVDSLDFFALDIRRAVFAACEAKGIPAVTAAPLGMGSALLVFMPGTMGFEDYFGLEGQSEDDQALRFMMGLAPARLHIPYLADRTRVDFHARKAPSTPMACELCAGFAGSYVLKILLNRGDVPVAPRGLHFDAYRNKLTKTWRPGGNRNPIQRLGFLIAKQLLKTMGKKSLGNSEDTLTPASPMERILDRARWAPSGDNEQPWQFEIVDDNHLIVHSYDTRDWCVYDLDGSSSQLALGALLETISIAASAEGLVARIQRRDTDDSALCFDVHFQAAQVPTPHPLLPFIEHRVTQRRPLTTRALTSRQKQAMEASLGEGYRVIWLEGSSTRWRVAKLLFRSAHIRLTTPEAYAVHRQNIEWGAQFSEDRIPEYAVGADRLTGKVMRWALHSWKRVSFLNRFFAGTWLPRLQMDLLTGIGCGAHFVLVGDRSTDSVDGCIEGGRAVQRFWLEATRQGLQFQPEMTPLIFSRYVAQQRSFTEVKSEQQRAQAVAVELSDILQQNDYTQRVFMGRVGFGNAPTSRSIRPRWQSLLRPPSGE